MAHARARSGSSNEPHPPAPLTRLASLIMEKTSTPLPPGVVPSDSQENMAMLGSDKEEHEQEKEPIIKEVRRAPTLARPRVSRLVFLRRSGSYGSRACYTAASLQKCRPNR